MTDMSNTIIAKSDQLNSDDLIGRSITVTVTKVSLLAGEQPVAIGYDGDNGKPWKPCKSMRRVLVGVWGSDGNAYIGRRLTLFRDEKVIFGGAAVGGIRISHMSHIQQPVTMALTASKAVKRPFTVQPLVEAPNQTLEDALFDIEHAPTLEGMKFKYEAAYAKFTDPGERTKILAAAKKRKTELTELTEQTKPTPSDTPPVVPEHASEINY